MQKTSFVTGEYYHIYNRGVDKRDVFLSKSDLDRFLQSMIGFNVEEPIGSLYWNSFGPAQLRRETSKLLVNIICYCLNPNHYHFILEQLVDGGISEFMKRLGGGYTKYFNIQQKRSGVLFQGVFKSKYIDSNEYLLHLSSYINLNDSAHRLKRETSKSSWPEYSGAKGEPEICKKDIILSQFKNKKEYSKFALESLKNIRERKESTLALENLLLD